MRSSEKINQEVPIPFNNLSFSHMIQVAGQIQEHRQKLSPFCRQFTIFDLNNTRDFSILDPQYEDQPVPLFIAGTYLFFIQILIIIKEQMVLKYNLITKLI